jgi:hypothetical protein
VLYGMVRSPSLNDRQLAKELGERPSTVTTVRARLFERGLCRRAYFPSLEALGAEVFALSHGGVSSGCLADLGKALGRGLFPAGECKSFLALAGPFGWLEMGAFRSYSEAQGRSDGLLRVLAGLPGGTAGQPCTRKFYPMEMVRFHNFFDFAPLLGRRFCLPDAPKPARQSPSVPPRRLSTVEGLALYGLVKWPGSPDGEIAGQLGVSRQAVARVRCALVGEGRLRPAVVPDLGRLGFGMLALLHFRFDARASPEAVAGALGRLLDGVPHIFAMSAGAECVVLGAYRDLASFEKGTAGPGRQFVDPGLLDGPQEVQTFLLADTAAVRDHDYVPFVKAALGLDIAD